MDVSLAAVPAEDCLCCYQVQWYQREAPVRRAVDSVGRWWFDLFALNWKSPWRSEHLMQGTAFAANIGVADYFRLMHGLTRQQWFKDRARTQSTPTGGTGFRLARGPTADERLESEAQSVFAEFCQRTTDLTRDAEQSGRREDCPPGSHTT
jgi:hypothetical protein